MEDQTRSLDPPTIPSLISVLKHVPEACVIIDTHFAVQYMNARAEDIAQQCLAMSQGISFRAVFSQEICAKLEPVFDHTLQSQTEMLVDIQYLESWFAVRLYPSPEGITLVFQDMTLRKQYESDLKQSQESFQFLANWLPVIVFSVDKDLKRNYKNQRYDDYAIPDDKTENRLDIDPIAIPDAFQLWDEVTKAGKVFETEYRIRRQSDKTWRWHLVRAIPMRNANNEITHWFGTCTDIDDQKHIEQRLLDEEKRKDAFMATVGHELRTPITIIRGNVQLVSKKIDDLIRARILDPTTAIPLHTANKLLDRAILATTRLTQLVQDLLDLTMIQNDKLKFYYKEEDIIAAIQEMIDEQQMLWPERRLIWNAPVTSTLIECDIARIQQVITNLLSNALKYSQADEPIIILLEDHADVFRFSVQDAGPGLTTEQQRYLWQQYSTVPEIKPYYASRMGLGTNMGLGLYICKNIIDRHQGTVGITSTPGVGSTFWFTLPKKTSATSLNVTEAERDGM